MSGQRELWVSNSYGLIYQKEKGANEIWLIKNHAIMAFDWQEGEWCYYGKNKEGASMAPRWKN